MNLYILRDGSSLDKGGGVEARLSSSQSQLVVMIVSFGFRTVGHPSSSSTMLQTQHPLNPKLDMFHLQHLLHDQNKNKKNPLSTITIAASISCHFLAL